MFVLQDTDGSGKISARELQKAFVAKAATLEEELTMLEAEEILNVVDVNGDNEIKREELVLDSKKKNYLFKNLLIISYLIT